MSLGMWYKLKCILRSMFRNKLRFFLTESGIVLSLVLFLGSYMILDSIYYSKFDEIAFWKENGIVKLMFNKTLSEKEIERTNEMLGEQYLAFREAGFITLGKPAVINGKSIQLSIQRYETNNNFNGELVYSGEDLYHSTLVEGTGITQENIVNRDNVIVIGQSLSNALFCGDAVGNTVRIPYYELHETTNSGWVIEKYQVYTIVGVYDDSDMVDIEQSLEQGVLSTSAYVPWGNEYVEEEDTAFSFRTLVFTGQNLSLYEKTEYQVKTTSLIDWTDYDVLKEQIEDQYSWLRDTANIVTVAILIMATLMLCQTMIFSIKERISEFGIKRALGATPQRIVVELIIESLIYAIIAFVLSFLGSMLLSNAFIYVAHVTEWMPDVFFHVRGKSILVSFLLAVFTSLNSIIFPLIYLDKTSIVDTIRFE